MKTSGLFLVRSGEKSMLQGLLRTALGLSVSLLALSAGPSLPMKIGTVVWFGYGPFYAAKLQELFRQCRRKLVTHILAGLFATRRVLGEWMLGPVPMRRAPGLGGPRDISIGLRGTGREQGGQQNQSTPDQGTTCQFAGAEGNGGHAGKHDFSQQDQRGGVGA
jgi:hypothetical protein